MNVGNQTHLNERLVAPVTRMQLHRLELSREGAEILSWLRQNKEWMEKTEKNGPDQEWLRLTNRLIRGFKLKMTNLGELLLYMAI